MTQSCNVRFNLGRFDFFSAFLLKREQLYSLICFKFREFLVCFQFDSFNLFFYLNKVF